ncbi:tetratricopeptide repeat protein [Sorangium sp. So ce341]|uniref:tetratricopeptide repeat protein n=1 Tax=Sorangium sp. So ce341 TaxID=3133302 RepID=UPI003F5FDA67
MPSLPALERCIGRDAAVDELAAAVSREPPTYTLVVGAPGIGKSTALLAALHRPEVAARFGERRFLAPLDAATDAESAVAALAAALEIAPGPDLRERALLHLAERPAALALDDIDTAWNSINMAEVELLFTQLARVPGLSLVAAVRGFLRPRHVAWSRTVEIHPLDPAHAEEMFCSIAGEEHRGKPELPALLSQLSGIPLAIALLARSARGADLPALLTAWEARGIALLEPDGEPADRRRSWRASLELTIQSPLGAEGYNHRMLSLLGVLPDGIARSDLAAFVDGLGSSMASGVAGVRLATFAGDRVRMPAPVRAYVAAAYPPSAEDLEEAMDRYGWLAEELGPLAGHPGGADAVARLSAEAANLDAMIQRGLQRADASRWIDAAVALTRFTWFSGNTPPSLIEHALAAARRAGDARREAACLESLGSIALARSQHEEATARFEEALPLYRKLEERKHAAHCIRSLGSIALARSQHEEATARFEEALPLYREAGSVLGEANCIQHLGQVAYRRSWYAEASARYQEAKLLYRKAGSVLGEADCIEGLGDIAFQLSRYQRASERYEEAKLLYRKVGSLRGEGRCIEALGDIARRRRDEGAARDRYAEALACYQQIPDPFLIGSAHRRLAAVAAAPASREAHLEAAAASWRSIGRVDLVALIDRKLAGAGKPR